MIVSNTHELTITSMWQYVNTRKCWLVDHYKIYNLTFMNFSKVCMVLKSTKKSHPHKHTWILHFIYYIPVQMYCTTKHILYRWTIVCLFVHNYTEFPTVQHDTNYFNTNLWRINYTWIR